MAFLLALAVLVAAFGAVASLALVALDAAGLIDLWAEYPTGPPFPGFRSCLETTPSVRRVHLCRLPRHPPRRSVPRL